MARNISSAEAFRLRMETQCHEIEQYRLAEIRDCGRTLTLDQAAHEWIAQFAADFSCRYASRASVAGIERLVNP